ncbi:hypothetical protein UFOVP153_23 [uncultured Caudovirales phage]|uniref:Uncharacterized protein n=1 Tax=uncultured Caudovirales phage TaxID=2100421 RepID=A0A6J5KYB5_9CAUD|nr:hypothetical protein UFOVP69_35 [uncultured Caudovirales phage]CAB5170479.1 hypothetical protein UFOVP153_23 [uncultured Caudovirales phage]
MTMPFEDRGKYITILCLMHQQGRLKEETIRFVVGSVSVNLKSKFIIDSEGNWFNERLELEIEKRQKFSESRRENGKKGGRKPIGNPSAYPSDKPLGKPKNNHTEDVNENVNEDEELKIQMPFTSSAFLQIWEQWKEYKWKEHKFKYKTSQSVQAALMDLSKKANGNEMTAIEIIGQSMANAWKGFFELKNNNNGKAKTTVDLRTAVQAEFDKRYGGGK